MPLLTTAQALGRLGWSSRSSLWRAERDGRIARAARGSRGAVLWESDDVYRLAGADPSDQPADLVSDLDDAELLRRLQEQVAEDEELIRRRARTEGTREDATIDELVDAWLGAVR